MLLLTVVYVHVDKGYLIAFPEPGDCKKHVNPIEYGGPFLSTNTDQHNATCCACFQRSDRKKTVTADD